MDIRFIKNAVLTIVVSTAIVFPANAQQVLSLQDCKQMAVDNNNDLKIARQNMKISGYDKKIAASYFYPKITAAGTYQWMDKDVPLISEEKANSIRNAGTTIEQSMAKEMVKVLSDPVILDKIASEPALQHLLLNLAQVDLAGPINAIGKEITDALYLDMHNIYAGIVTLEQPVFVGGKIFASHKMAKYAEDLSKVQYEQAVQQVEVDIEQAYWQIVSIACKKALAEGYSKLLRQFMDETLQLMQEGMATVSDSLSVKVKSNEAEMLLVKATNGLSLAKMLLCQRCGLALDSDIVLADELATEIPEPGAAEYIPLDEVMARRPEMQSLNLANKIYDKKVAVARADMMPSIALTASYLLTNPSVNDGYRNEFGGRFVAGVAIKIPIFHGTEALQRTRKAKAEAEMMSIKMDDAREKISLQVAQCRKLMDEAFSKMAMARSEVADAEENLRAANDGYSEGVITPTVVMAAQTAWLKARSEMIETAVELQMAGVNLAKAEGRLQTR